MDYQSIFKRSFNIIWRHKFLWLLGFLIGGSPFQFLNLTFNGNDWQKFQNEWQNTLPSDTTSLVMANTKSLNQVLNESIGPVYSNAAFWIALTLFVALIILCLYLSVTARGAIIRAVADIAGEKGLSLKHYWQKGHKYFWRLLSLSLLGFAIFITLLFVFITPVVLLAIFSFKIPAVILGLILFLVFLTSLIYFSMIFPLAERMIVLERKKAFPALCSACTYFNRRWREWLAFFLVLFALNIVIGIALMFAISGVVLIAIIVGIILYFIFHLLAWAFAVIAGIALVFVILAFLGAVRAFISSNLTLAYLDLNSKE